MKISSDVLYKTAQIILSRIVPALSVLVVLFALFCLGLICISTYGCHSEPPKPEEIELERDISDDETKCREGFIVKIEGITYDYMVVLVQEQNSNLYWTALAHSQENFRVGDRIETCYHEVLTNPHSKKFVTIGIAKRSVTSRYELSELEKLEKREEELRDCNDHVSTLIKAIESKGSPSN